MTETDQPYPIARYSFMAKLLHWSFVVLFAYGIFKQVDTIEQLEEISFLQFEIIFALVFLVFLIFRFFYMFRTQKTSLPPNTPTAHKLAAKVVHFSMYICLAGIALSGLAIGCFFWLGLKSGLIINSLIWIHEVTVSLIYWLICLHIVAAIYHRLKQDGVWNSMVPIWKENTN
ncbi:MAG: cytochrome b/b6 domain-containing protein [Pseudomonadota bacterium]|nr:cytochrome b/b6 domain-containing protein [Pseudomonadota bacterium]